LPPHSKYPISDVIIKRTLRILRFMLAVVYLTRISNWFYTRINIIHV